MCQLIGNRVMKGSKLLLETLLASNRALVKDSDIASLGKGRILMQCARAYLTAKDDKQAFISIMAELFPGLSIADLVVEKNYMFAPVIANGGHSLISLLGRFYRDLMVHRTCEERNGPRLPYYARLRFLCLCFHLSQSYLLTADVVWQMWTDTLCMNSITSMFNGKTQPTQLKQL